MEELHDPVSKRVGRVLRKTAKNRVLRAHSYPKKAPSVSDRYLPLKLGEKGPRLNSLELLLRSLGASADSTLLSGTCPKMIPRLHRSCILQGSAMRGKSV